MATRIQHRRDVAADWTAANPILAAGETGVETDTGKFKIGDGTTPWTGLAYFTPGGGNGTSAALIEEVAPTGVATVTFASIPQTYRHLEVRGSLVLSGTQGVRLRFNGDTAANYDIQLMRGAGAAASAVEALAQTYLEIAAGTSGRVSPLLLSIPGYRDGTVERAVTNVGGLKTGTASGNLRMDLGVGWWRGTAAVSSLTLIVAGASTFAAGTRIGLYGIGG